MNPPKCPRCCGANLRKHSSTTASPRFWCKDCKAPFTVSAKPQPLTAKQKADRAAIRRVIRLLQSQHTEDLAVGTVVEVLEKLSRLAEYCDHRR